MWYSNNQFVLYLLAVGSQGPLHSFMSLSCCLEGKDFPAEKAEKQIYVLEELLCDISQGLE